MAKKKVDATPTPKPNGLVIRGSQEWRDWVKEAADADRTTVADFLDRAAASYAKKIGFAKQAPRR